MSYNFENKHYKEYFKNLEENIKKEFKNENKVSEKKPSSKKYRVIRIKPSVVLSSVAVVLVICLIVYIAKSSAPKVPKEAEENQETVSAERKEKLGELAGYAKYTDSTVEITDETDSKNVIVIDAAKNTVVAARDAETRVFPASTTKIMTILTAAENIDDLNETFTMSYEITDPLYKSEATLAGFSNGEKVTVKDMLYGAILPSGADATVGLAIKTAGSEEEFVKLMNKKAKQLKLKNTHFDNTSGLYSNGNYTSAHDMAVILKAAMENEVCREVLSAYQHTTAATPQHPEGITLTSTLFSHMYGTEPETATIKGGKTGYINESGYCIASFGENNTNKNEYIVVTLGGSSLWPAIFGQIELYKKFAK
ncbi:MAG: D-alanyl-D-alanine carboxypeptidase [Clostridia bacterium]|nr:D-alanyl-D-alanine carboxypeptidase [Clostridia bacterium]